MTPAELPVKNAIGIGIDLVDVDEVERAVGVHGHRYLERVYSPRERRECRADPRRLAMRFAAKEATMKAFGRDDAPLPWHSIALERRASEGFTVVLTGAGAELARARGAVEVHVDVASTSEIAAAVVMVEFSR